jgi:enediyne biosynthesis thioesterase
LKCFEYRHTIGFEETNVVGNVYYVNHLRWQGRCREMFLREHAPCVLEEMARGLALVTTNCSCEYLEELSAFDPVVVSMRLSSIGQSRITMEFEYWRGETLVARGSQGVACMRRENGVMRAEALPLKLRAALEPYAR